MTLSYNLGYLETILVHPTRRQRFANTVQSRWTQDLTPNPKMIIFWWKIWYRWEQSPLPTQIFWVLYSRLLADFLSHLGKWVELVFSGWIIYGHFYTWKVETPQNDIKSPSFHNVNVTKWAIIEGTSIFVTFHVCTHVNQSLVQMCALKLRFLLRHTRVDSEYLSKNLAGGSDLDCDDRDSNDDDDWIKLENAMEPTRFSLSWNPLSFILVLKKGGRLKDHLVGESDLDCDDDDDADEYLSFYLRHFSNFVLNWLEGGASEKEEKKQVYLKGWLAIAWLKPLSLFISLF